jgi:predicted Co/Zn/Cd cation transporter (cation efflux family)
VRPEGLGNFKKSPHRVSNPRPSGLQHSALTTTLQQSYTTGIIFSLLAGSMTVYFTTIYALLAGKHIDILPMNQYVSWLITFGMDETN